MNSMTKTILFTTGLMFAVPLSMSYAQDRIYGSQLMTKQERVEHRNKMQSFKTQQEREQYRIEHHKKMQERAEQQGKTLPDMRPQGEGMKGQGGGMGKGR